MCGIQIKRVQWDKGVRVERKEMAEICRKDYNIQQNGTLSPRECGGTDAEACSTNASVMEPKIAYS